MDLYNLAEVLAALGVSRYLREALPLPEFAVPAADVAVWETICLNRGLRVKVFHDRADAVKWLLVAGNANANA